jgi:flagellar basal-body rod protein FlgB
MIVNRLLNQDATPVLERTLAFTEARQQLLADNIANATTPNYQQKDLSVSAFQAQLRDRVEAQSRSGPGAVSFDDITTEAGNPSSGILFHDGNNRSMEQLMTENAKNVLMHNLVVELLRRQYQTMDMALKEKPS